MKKINAFIQTLMLSSKLWEAIVCKTPVQFTSFECKETEVSSQLANQVRSRSDLLLGFPIPY